MEIDYSIYKFLKVEVEDEVATVTLNRPEVLNAANFEMGRELSQIYSDLGEDEKVRAVVVTGAGRAFCSGYDIKEGGAGRWTSGRQLPPRPLMFGDGMAQQRVLTAILNLDKPIISAVNGAAVGYGATIALFSDIIIAAETARFGDTHISVGLVPGDGGMVIWPILVGMAKAKELLMTGDIINAREVERIGLVNKVVPLKDLMPMAKELARRLAHGPTLAIGWTKHNLNRKIRQDMSLLMEVGMIAEHMTYFSEDNKEANKAFVEKRPPQFKGR